VVSLSGVGNFPFLDRYAPRLASELPLFIHFRQFMIAVSDLEMQLVSGVYGTKSGDVRCYIGSGVGWEYMVPA
jgi:hypothetical protein